MIVWGLSVWGAAVLHCEVQQYGGMIVWGLSVWGAAVLQCEVQQYGGMGHGMQPYCCEEFHCSYFLFCLGQTPGKLRRGVGTEREPLE